MVARARSTASEKPRPPLRITSLSRSRTKRAGLVFCRSLGTADAQSEPDRGDLFGAGRDQIGLGARHLHHHREEQRLGRNGVVAVGLAQLVEHHAFGRGVLVEHVQPVVGFADQEGVTHLGDETQI